MNINDITITSIETITVFDMSGNYKFTLDELQSASISQSQESSEITGKAGRKLATLKRNKAVTVSGTNGLVSGGLLEMQTGCEFTDDSEAEILWTDYLTVGDGNKINTTYKAAGTTGAEIEALYIKNNDSTLGAKLEQSAAAASGKFVYTPSTKVLQFHTDVAAGTEIVVYYKRKISASVLKNDSDKYSEKGQMFIDALAEDKCANVYRLQVYIPKGDFSGEFSFEMGENQTVHSFEAEALAGACGAGGAFWTYTLFGSSAADV